jgi:hypothetical protein
MERFQDIVKSEVRIHTRSYWNPGNPRKNNLGWHRRIRRAVTQEKQVLRCIFMHLITCRTINMHKLVVLQI